MAILWLASFPKSGNTWLRAFLANYFADLEAPVSLSVLQSFGFSDAHGWPYEKISGKPHGFLGEAKIARLRSQTQAMFSQSQPDNVLVKTHNALGTLSGQPLITPIFTVGAVYIIRNPWDTVISYSDHFGISIDDAITAFAQPSLTIDPSANNVRQYLGGWSGHAASWSNAQWLKLRTIRYEDMTADPETAFGQVIDFLSLPPDRKRLRKAIKFSSFRELSQQESRNGFSEKSKSAEKFFRKGKAGGWRDILTDDQAKRLLSDHRAALEHFGYLNADGSIKDTA
jgi:hypothetical protein